MILNQPDAHSGAGIAEVSTASASPERAGRRRKNILNTRTTDEVEQVFQRRRR